MPAKEKDPMMKKLIVPIGIAAAVLLAAALRGADAPPKASAGNRIFEMRTYTANDGKLEALNARFRNHTNKLFEKHGATLIGYWIPAEGDRAKDTLVYILAFPSKEAQQKMWRGFREDAEWNKARTESEKDGPLVKKVEAVLLNPTDYSAIK
jgi:hypothetical protein